MRRLLLALMTAGLVSCSSGCLINLYDSDPNERVKQLLNQSEDMRVIRQEWQRIWFTDHPSHLNPDRIDGAIQ